MILFQIASVVLSGDMIFMPLNSTKFYFNVVLVLNLYLCIYSLIRFLCWLIVWCVIGFFISSFGCISDVTITYFGYTKEMYCFLRIAIDVLEYFIWFFCFRLNAKKTFPCCCFANHINYMHIYGYPFRINSNVRDSNLGECLLLSFSFLVISCVHLWNTYI